MCTSKERVFTVFFAFAGIGGGAIGFQQATATLEKLGLKGRFEVIGAFDVDAGAAADFEALTGVKCDVIDVRTMTPAWLRAKYPRRPDVVFGSAPCTGASGLLSNDLAETEKYQEMNSLMLVWTKLMLAAWSDDLPLLNINENVPRLVSRAKDVVSEVVRLHQKAGYVVHAGTHECGEVGGLAQRRTRFLMLARLVAKVGALVYQPPKQRVRGCGEVIGPLPLPSDPAGGAMHALPDICATNWIRLALIPPGGDWRDIEGALAAHEKRREHWSRYHVARFDCATPTVAGSGTNGAYGVEDARVADAVRRVAHNPDAHRNKYVVTGWGTPVGTIIGAAHIGSGAPSLDDARLPTPAYPLMYGVRRWDQPSVTLTGKAHLSCGAFSVDDVRLESAFKGKYEVMEWELPSRTVIGGPNNGASYVDDVRVQVERRNDAYGVLALRTPAGTITSAEGPSTGRFSVADDRVASSVRAHAYHFTNEMMLAAWSLPARTVTGASHLGNGAGAIEDLRVRADRYGMNWRVEDPTQPGHTITGTKNIQAGSPSFADPRLFAALCGGGYSFTNNLMLAAWTVPARTITGAVQVGCGGLSVVDLRVHVGLPHTYGVLAFAAPSHTITGNMYPGGGPFSLEDVRVPSAYPWMYGVLGWNEPGGAITGNYAPGGGAFALVDVRLTCTVRETSRVAGVLDWSRAAFTITAWGDVNNGPFAVSDPRPVTPVAATLPSPEAPAPKKGARRRKVARRAEPGVRVRRRGGHVARCAEMTFTADPRVPGNPALALRFPVSRLDRAPLFVPVLATSSGAWHRPLTIWERFALQGFPLYDANGQAIVLGGHDVTEWSTRVGNAVPPPTAKAIAEEMLITLLSAEAGVFTLTTRGGGAWVRGKPAPAWMRVLGVIDLYPAVDERACGSLAVIEEDDPWASLVGVGSGPRPEVLQ